MVKRKFTSYPVHNLNEIKNQMLNWSNQFSILCFLDNHKYNFFSSSYECLVAAGSLKKMQTNTDNAFGALQQFKTENEDWVFGHFSYDLKNQIENLSSSNIDRINFPDIFFFIPEILFMLSESEIKIGIVDGDPDKIFDAISSVSTKIKKTTLKIPEIKSRFSKAEYILCIRQLHKHILRGDCYEINFCQEFFAEDAVIDPVHVYNKLGNLSPNPFSAFYKVDHNYLICASPERYLQKKANKIYAQPIKGTSKRELNDSIEDESNRLNLQKSGKERAENVMVVDLVRNDLSKVCIEGSVKVEELFGIYSFPQVHQMVSTISGTLKNKNDLPGIFKATFPMGSMTGAPKKKVMELIEQHEKTRRGIFSGALGYIDPEGDFDFNVVIRSIIYNALNKYISLPAGSAITFNSDPEKEYEECLLKIEALIKALE